MGTFRKSAATLTGMRALKGNKRLGRLSRRAWRRMMVGGLVLGWGTGVAALQMPGLPAALRLAPLLFAAMLGLLLILATRNLASSLDEFADERDRAVRDRAHRLAYWAFGPLVGAVIGWLLTIVLSLRDGRELLLGAEAAPRILAASWTLFVLYCALPVAILAWTEPDPPEEPAGIP
jgi:MFS family permease